MAYDRPSPKLLSFLAKNYCLTQSVPQVPSALNCHTIIVPNCWSSLIYFRLSRPVRLPLLLMIPLKYQLSSGDPNKFTRCGLRLRTTLFMLLSVCLLYLSRVYLATASATFSLILTLFKGSVYSLALHMIHTRLEVDLSLGMITINV